MKAVLIFAGCIALAAGTFPFATHEVTTKKLDDKLVEVQKKVLSLLDNVRQRDEQAEYYNVGKDYSIESNAGKYDKPDVVTTFLEMWNAGFMPKYYPFSIFYERQREEAVILYELFYHAKDFETLYKTAAWARVHVNEGQFLYAFYTAILQRHDTKGVVLPAPYELWPHFFINTEALYKMYRVQMQEGIPHEEIALSLAGILKKENNYYYYYNYSGPETYGDDEHWISYLTEDIGWNSYYYYFHTQMPFWGEGKEILGPFKERRGEIYFNFYQQLLARYYLERLSNGMGEIPKFAWWSHFKTPYYPFLRSNFAPFAQRSKYYYLGIADNTEDIQFLDTYEKTFMQFLQKGQFKAYKYEVDLHNSKSINFIGNYWQSNHDLYEKTPRNYERSYEVIARRILSAAPDTTYDYEFLPSALDFYQTSLRDPAFYQLYAKIMDFILQYKEWLEPYSQDILHYPGVKINNVKVDKLYTFFDYYDFNATNAIYYTQEERTGGAPSFIVRQPRLNHKPFSLTIDVKSDVEGEAVFKVFMGPKYDGEGRILTLKDNWMNFVELDWFIHKLTSGPNKIERSSEEFFFYKEDSVSVSKIWHYLQEGKVPKDMSEDFDYLPQRLMLPRGTKGGFPVQFFVFVYPYQALNKEWEPMKSYVLDNKPFGYPFDRPVPIPYSFIQPNMYFEDVYIYQEGEEYPWLNEEAFKYTQVNH